jgi:glycosyltransferase involved in cell wall biosynthesis
MNEPTNPATYFRNNKVCVIIPTFNNGQTVGQVVEEVKGFCRSIIVVNDGSTDNSMDLLEGIPGIELISYPENKGKGFAIRQGFQKALDMGFEHAFTFDADGQHHADDFPAFVEKMKSDPDALMVGARNIAADGMPGKNTFANKFSNFWFWVETGRKLPDTQSGFRLYPIKFYRDSKFFSRKYEFEVEVLVRSAWSGITILPVPVKVSYPEDRVSHFRPLPDFVRISLLNTILVLITFLYIVPRNVILYFKRNKFSTIVREQLKAHNQSPFKVSAALGFGVFMGIVPIWGFQMITAAFVAHFLRLNKILVLAASNISIPPMIPFIVYFSYKTGGWVLGSESELSKATLIKLKNQVLEGNFYNTFQELGYSIYQYVVGAFAFGALMGLLTGSATLLMILFTRLLNKRSV